MIKIFGKPNCIYCTTAKNLLNAKGIPYEYTELTTIEEQREAIEQISPDTRTFPMVIVDGEFIGGSTQLKVFLNDNPGYSNGSFNSILFG